MADGLARPTFCSMLAFYADQGSPCWRLAASRVRKEARTLNVALHLEPADMCYQRAAA